MIALIKCAPTERAKRAEI